MTPPPPTAPDAIKRFRRWGAIAVALATIGYLAYAVWKGLSETAVELAQFRWSLYIPVLGLTLVNYGLRYFKWDYLLRRLGIHIPHRTNLAIFACGLAMVISPAKAGEVVKPYLVKQCSGAPITTTLPALVVERGTDGLAVIILAAFGVSTYASDDASIVYGLMLATFAAMAIVSVRPLAVGSIRLIGRLPMMERVSDKLMDAYEPSRICLQPAPVIVTTVTSVVAWFAECVGYWLIFMGLKVPASLDLSTFLYASATVLGAPSPGGMGVADVALTEAAIQLAAATAPQAVAAALLVRLATLWFGVAIGAVALLRMEAIIEHGRAAPS